jgi:PAS domain S-box-containing protein
LKADSLLSMLEVMDDQAVLFLDRAGNIKEWNSGAVRLTKYLAAEVIGNHFSYFFETDEESVKTAVRFIQEAMLQGSSTYEGWLLKRGNEPFWAFACTAASYDEENSVTGFSMLIRDLTEKHQSRLATEEYLRKLALKKRELDQFVYIASHDLQEPLLNVRNFVELFRMEYLESFDQDAHLYMQNIDKATEKMRNLIKGLLDHSRLSMDQTRVSVNCDAVMNDLLSRVSGIVKATGAKIQYKNLPVVQGFESGLKQLFGHLLSNALKFSRADLKPRIDISAVREGNFWKFEFADNGIGIESRFYEKIFGMFQRLHGVEKYQGDGVGLTHCRKIVELHGGKIWVESIPGEGSKFCFTIQIFN